MNRDEYIDCLIGLRNAVDDLLRVLMRDKSDYIESTELKDLAKSIVADLESTSKIGDEQLQANLDKSNQQMQSALQTSGAESV